MLTAAAYDIHVRQLFQLMWRLHALLTDAGIPYRIVGGMAVFIHVYERDPLRARLTADVDAAIERANLDSVVEAAHKAGWIFRHAGGVDMLVDGSEPRARSAVHLVFLNEKVRPEYEEAVPASTPDRTREGILVAPVADIVRMKLTSFRLKDRVHIQDLDGVGLITREIEEQLPKLLSDRLTEIRASE
jgi:hypothetical protein